MSDMRGRELPADLVRAIDTVIVQHLGHEPTFGGVRVEATTTRLWSWN
jgi:hypothetical protein